MPFYQKQTIYARVLVTLVILIAPALANAEQTERLTMGDDTLEIRWIKTESFDDESWQERWVVESQGPRVYAEAGELKVRLVDDNRKMGGVTVWLRDELPDDVVIRVLASTDERVDNNACNLNFFVHAREQDGAPLEFNRDGDYKSYHDIPNYLFTLTGGITPGWSRARLDPGFELISDCQDIRSEPGKAYAFLIVIEGKRVRYYLDGELVHDYEVASPLKGGWFGLRTWFSQVNYEEISIGQLIGERG